MYTCSVRVFIQLYYDFSTNKKQGIFFVECLFSIPLMTLSMSYCHKTFLRVHKGHCLRYFIYHNNNNNKCTLNQFPKIDDHNLPGIDATTFFTPMPTATIPFPTCSMPFPTNCSPLSNTSPVPSLPS